jgi:hypothetical protein
MPSPTVGDRVEALPPRVTGWRIEWAVRRLPRARRPRACHDTLLPGSSPPHLPPVAGGKVEALTPRVLDTAVVGLSSVLPGSPLPPPPLVG